MSVFLNYWQQIFQCKSSNDRRKKYTIWQVVIELENDFQSLASVTSLNALGGYFSLKKTSVISVKMEWFKITRTRLIVMHFGVWLQNKLNCWELIVFVFCI